MDPHEQGQDEIDALLAEAGLGPCRADTVDLSGSPDVLDQSEVDALLDEVDGSGISFDEKKAEPKTEDEFLKEMNANRYRRELLRIFNELRRASGSEGYKYDGDSEALTDDCLVVDRTSLMVKPEEDIANEHSFTYQLGEDGGLYISVDCRTSKPPHHVFRSIRDSLGKLKTAFFSYFNVEDKLEVLDPHVSYVRGKTKNTLFARILESVFDKVSDTEEGGMKRDASELIVLDKEGLHVCEYLFGIGKGEYGEPIEPTFYGRIGPEGEVEIKIGYNRAGHPVVFSTIERGLERFETIYKMFMHTSPKPLEASS